MTGTQTAPAATLSGKTRSVVAPAKQTMNFVRRKKHVNFAKIALAVVLVAAAAVVFAKFGIVDQLEKKLAAETKLNDLQAREAEILTDLEGYEELAAQYGRYSYGWMTERETGTVDRLAIISLIEEKVMKTAEVQSFAINDNVLTMNLHGLTLAEASDIVNALESSELVERATVDSATAVTPAPEVEEDKEDKESAADAKAEEKKETKTNEKKAVVGNEAVVTMSVVLAYPVAEEG